MLGAGTMTVRALVLLVAAAACGGAKKQAPRDPEPEVTAPTEQFAEPLPPAPDPLAGKTPQEQWAWAQSVLPDLAHLTPAPQAADFAALGLRKNKVTLYAVGLELGIFKPPDCLALPFVFKDGAFETRVDIRGEKANLEFKVNPELKDYYTVLRLGVTLETVNPVHKPDQLLAESSPGVIRYEGRRVEYAAYCATASNSRECGGKTMTCETCKPFLHELDDFGRAEPMGGHAPGTPHDCSACPPDPVGPYIGALNDMVQERLWMEVLPGAGPSFYTTNQACTDASRNCSSATRCAAPCSCGVLLRW